MSRYIMHDLQRTKMVVVTTCPTPRFGNFHNIATTGMGKDELYRGSHPHQPGLGRNTYVDAALKQAGVNVIMNLANSQGGGRGLGEGFADTYYSGQKVIYLTLGVDFSRSEFQKSLAEGLQVLRRQQRVPTMSLTEGRPFPLVSALWSA